MVISTDRSCPRVMMSTDNHVQRQLDLISVVISTDKSCPHVIMSTDNQVQLQLDPTEMVIFTDNHSICDDVH